ncbi:MAG: VanZ family protein [Candidatus Moranbacteria bacterium]|nr:VanZ family protein [Candidatus Moranbacteria bacterium]NTW75966.1 VanZ family protein [Candidatus Moranbacteria bacterium]
MHFLRSRSRAISALFIWMAVIYLFSSMPGSGSGSQLTLRYLLERKGAHVFEYLVLSLLAFNAFRLAYPKERSGFHVSLAIALSLLYAFSDETHQLFVPGREGKLSDVGIDLIGMAAGAISVALLPRKHE